MFVSIINDCRDPNAMNRQVVRAASLFHCPVSGLGVENELEAAGNLIDALDAANSEPGVILVNVAPRHGKGKRWPNGTPFGFFRVGETLVGATIDGLCLSLIKKFGLAESVEYTDLPTVLDAMIAAGKFPADDRDRVVRTQFRSFEYLPRLAAWVVAGENLPTESHPIAEVPDAPAAIWWVDNFGNCKTTILPEEVGHEAGKVLHTEIGPLTCYARLKDVPNGEPGLIVGSSGLGQQRFLEVVVQGKSAAQRFDITAGTVLFAG